MDATDHEYELEAKHFKNYNKLSGCIHLGNFLKQLSGKHVWKDFPHYSSVHLATDPAMISQNVIKLS
jgi:hypothetical protein